MYLYIVASLNGIENKITSFLNGDILKARDALGNSIEGRMTANVQGKFISVLVGGITHSFGNGIPDLPLIIGPSSESVIDNSEDPNLLVPYIKIPLIHALTQRVESVVESVSNRVFPEVNWLLINEISIIPGRYQTHRAIFRLVESHEPNTVRFQIDILNIQSTCNEVKQIADLTLVILKDSDKITFNIFGHDKYRLLEGSPIVGYVRNSISRLLADKGYIKKPKRFIQDEYNKDGLPGVSWTFNLD